MQEYVTQYDIMIECRISQYAVSVALTDVKPSYKRGKQRYYKVSEAMTAIRDYCTEVIEKHKREYEEYEDKYSKIKARANAFVCESKEVQE